MRSLAAQFGPALQAHLSLAFQELQVFSQREGGGLSGPQEQTPHREEAPHREEDLLLVLLKSQEEAAPDSFLLKEALEQRCPLLAVMAACQQVIHIILFIAQH